MWNLSKLVFIVDDEESILKMLVHWLKNQWGYNVRSFTKGMDAYNSLNENPDLVLLDIMLPDINGIDLLVKIKQKNLNLPVVMLSAQGSIEVALESIRQGAFDYFPKPIDKNRLEPAVRNAIRSYDLQREVENLKENLQREFSFDNIISADKKMQEAFKMVTKVLDNDITVLVQGESGTGKELFARAIHYNGNRKNDPFIVVNCASIPRELLESELFGHEKGAFTGAHQRKIGKFELAKTGTIFLDEIGEMEMSLQAKILRVIQNREFERVGGNEVLRSDVRIISATNIDLKDAVDKKLFREDLFYRLSSFPINIIPLRERRGDIVVLINHFIAIFNKKLNKNITGVTKAALKTLYDYDWPGNVRELENLIERSVILTDKDVIDNDVLPDHVVKRDQPMVNISGEYFSFDAPIIPFEKLKEEAIRHSLLVTEGNIVEAARKLKIGRATFYRLLDKYKIN